MNLHTVTVVPQESGTPQVTFQCSGTTDDICHVYPDERESWTEEEQRQYGTPQERCWIAGWFDGDCYDYVGDDAPEDEYGERSVPNVAQSGPIRVEYEQDYIAWGWALPDDKDHQ